MGVKYLINKGGRKVQFNLLTQIAFPGIGIKEFSVNPVAFNLFDKEIYWYGIIIALGLVLAFLWAKHASRDENLPKDTLADLLIVGLPSAIICARAYYVIFSWNMYKHNWVDVFKIWEGGIAIYGGVIGAFVAGLIYAKVKKIPFYKLADIAAPCFLIGQAIGRWGNFVNVEAYGSQTTLPWGMLIVQEGITVHPTFLYESLWNGIGFLILALLRKKKPFEGFIFYAYLLWYGLGRVWIEGLRTDSLMLGNLRISQLVAGVCIIASAITILMKWKNDSVKL
ncbi:MAG: prolipoprotein diacylglyceryl transferase [Clostridia bacterium]|nr:prolipoprotein diacylglyceryl transferase [Clostridia bacterium]